MARPKVCLVCQHELESWWEFCFHCGARVDNDVMDQVHLIDYIIFEIIDWHKRKTISYSVREELLQHYFTRRQELVQSIEHKAEHKTDEPVPSVDATDTPLSSLSEPTPPVAPAISNVVVPTRLSESQVVPATSLSPAPLPLSPPLPSKSFPELVAENINYIFAISTALFVGGIALYYRNEIYYGLKQPIVQAAILALVTLGALVSGWTLVRRTEQTIAGRTLTIVGSLLVPINPWFLVRSGLIPNTGKAWVLGLVCTALYAWTAYFLRDRLFVYIALSTGIITGWLTVYRFTGGISASIYAVVMMASAIGYLFAERAFKSRGEDVIFSREEYGQPFFHVAQTAIALCLFFYTPLIKLLPAELVAARYYFDPQSYNSFVTVWLALAAAFAYTYSAIIRKASYFVYLAIATLLWAEVSLLDNIDVTRSTAVLVFVASAFVIALIGRLSPLDNFFTRPLGHTAILIGLIVCCWVGYIILSLTFYHELLLDWSYVSSIFLAAGIFIIELYYSKKRSDLYAIELLLTAGFLFVMIKLHVPAYFIALLFLIPTYGALLLSRRLRGTEWECLTNGLHKGALVIIGYIILGVLANYQLVAPYKAHLAGFSLGVAGLFALSAFSTEGYFERRVQFYATILATVVSYYLLLKIFLLPDHNFALLIMLLPGTLMAGAALLQKKLSKLTSPVGEKLSETLSPLKISTLILMGVALFGWHPLYDFIDYHNWAGMLFMLEFAIALLILGYINNAFNHASFSVAIAFFTASYSYLLGIIGSGMSPEYALVGFAIWVFSLYTLARVEILHSKLRSSSYWLATTIAVLLFLASIRVIITSEWGAHPDRTIAVMITLLILLYHQIKSLWQARHAFPATFAGLIGMALLITLLWAASTGLMASLAWVVMVAIAYGGVAQLLRQRGMTQSVTAAIEIVANLAVLISLTTLLTEYSYDTPFSLMAFFVTALVVIFYALLAYWQEQTKFGQIYAHTTFSALLLSACIFAHHFGFNNWSELSSLLVPLLTLFLIGTRIRRRPVFTSAAFNVAQVAMPLVVILGLVSGLSVPITHIGTALFFSEIALFYFIAAGSREKIGFLYPALATLAVALWQVLLHFAINSSYFMAFYAVCGFLLLQLAVSDRSSRWAWARPAFSIFGNLLLALSASVVVMESFNTLRLLNKALDPLIQSLFIIIAIGALLSVKSEDVERKTIYRRATLALGCFSYFVIGIRLGYDVVRQTEFYSIPLGAALLVAGYLGMRKEQDKSATLWLWLGSLAWTLPLLLHALEYRFLTLDPSTTHDIALLIVALALILGGILMQLKAPTAIGGASFIIQMAVIVFSFVEREQKWLSISMIILGLVVFATCWIIYLFYKRNQLGQLSERGKQVVEELGKWK
ncbi:MAG: hypothetical protein AB1489_10685 [Acidobacteriota bacterium]